MAEKLRQSPFANPGPCAEIQEVRRLGYAVTPEENLLGINALAGPISNCETNLVGSIGPIESVHQIATPPNDARIQRLLQLTRDVSHALGGPMMD
jgi:IclR family transcriptional regulator, KDG regulon repressor